jgi:hypothetical protein
VAIKKLVQRNYEMRKEHKGVQRVEVPFVVVKIGKVPRVTNVDRGWFSCGGYPK